MASWFNNIIPSEALDVLDKVKEVSSKVKDSLPMDNEVIKKLTLRSDDLQAEHDLIDAQETRKEIVKDYLSNILPWETKDEARVILMDECRDSILSLSENGETFTGPFELPDTVETMFSENSGMTEATEDSRAEASKKLEKMGSLPQLLDEFDLYAHVGLIERLFKADTNLVRSHSLLESAGKSEQIFWKNYFFHCAYARYTVGLSVEEIWSVQSEPISVGKHPSDPSPTDAIDDAKSVELTFEQNDNENQSVASIHNDLDDAQEDKVNNSGHDSDYEVVNNSPDAMDEEELDELDAEIARELAEIDDL